jgi:hypothetical protein
LHGNSRLVSSRKEREGGVGAKKESTDDQHLCSLGSSKRRRFAPSWYPRCGVLDLRTSRLPKPPFSAVEFGSTIDNPPEAHSRSHHQAIRNARKLILTVGDLLCLACRVVSPWSISFRDSDSTKSLGTALVRAANGRRWTAPPFFLLRRKSRHASRTSGSVWQIGGR